MGRIVWAEESRAEMVLGRGVPEPSGVSGRGRVGVGGQGGCEQI